MQYQKIVNMLDTKPDTLPNSNTKKCIEVHHQSSGTYNTSKQIRFKRSILRSDLCDPYIVIPTYSNPYIVVKGTIAFVRPNDNVCDKKSTVKITHIY